MLLLSFAWLSACKSGGDPGYYHLAPDDAYARLTKADIIGFRDARQCGMLIYFTPTARADQRSVEWDVTSGDAMLARFTVHVTPKGAGSVVDIEVPQAPNGREIYDGTQQYSHPAFLQPLRPAVRELIDAAIQQRPYDWRRIPQDGPMDTTVCSSTRSNFEASGRPYELDDPSGMTHDQAEGYRARGVTLSVERDTVFADPLS